MKAMARTAALVAVAAMLAAGVSAQEQLPAGATPQAADPLMYAALIVPTPCPVNTTGTSISCTYPGTQTDPTKPVHWTCPAGYYCLGPADSDKFECNPGFYCPENAAQPIFCPRGLACSSNSTMAVVCPWNYFCPLGTVDPYACSFLGLCPAGSEKANKILVIVLFIVLAAAVYGIFYWKSKSDQERNYKRKREQESIARHTSIDEAKLDRLEKTFDIEFEDLGLTLPNGVTIMKGVTGALHSGRTCAIMGPSGAGKTTFVTLLTGKVKRTSGQVVVNGVPEELSKYRRLIGYVPQEDVMLRELTVRDILIHSARMRLPADWSYQRIKTKVLEIISFLGMSHVASSIIGDEETRGISGGQRKRVNIAMELVALPSLLILDEPTSGLDSSTSFEVCENLKNIARMQGLTVAAIIHSPSPATFRQFDDFMLLGKGGCLIYTGPREECVKYFESVGFTCPADESPSDFFMDVATGKVPSEFDPAFKPSDLFEYWIKTRQGVNPFEGQRRMSPGQAKAARARYMSNDLEAIKLSSPDKSVTPLLQAEKTTDYYGWTEYVAAGLVSIGREWGVWLYDVVAEFGEFVISVVNAVLMRQDPIRETCPYYMQIWLLMRRAALQVYKSPLPVITEMALHFSAGLFISIAVQNFGFLGVPDGRICDIAPVNVQWICSNPVDHLREAGMFIALGSFFAGISVGVNTFGREKVVYWRDTSTGMNTIPYYIAKFVVDFPRVVLGSAMFSLAVVLMFPYKQPFAQLYSIIIYFYFNAFAMGYWISTVFPLAKSGLIATGFALLWALVLSGVLPNLEDVSKFSSAIQWLWAVSAPRWGIEIFWLHELKALWWKEKERDPINTYKWGEEIPAYYKMLYIAIMWNLLAFLGLKLINRSKQK